MFGDWYRKLYDNPLLRSFLIAILGGAYAAPIYILKLPYELYVVPATIISASIIGFIYEAKDFKKLIISTFAESAQHFVETNYYSKDKLDAMIKGCMIKYYDLPDTLPPNNLLDFYRNTFLKHVTTPYTTDLKIKMELETQKNKLIWTNTRSYTLESLNVNAIDADRKFEFFVKPVLSEDRHFWFNGDYIEIDGQNIIVPEGKMNILDKGGQTVRFSFVHPIKISYGQKIRVKHKVTFIEKNDGEIIDHQYYIQPTDSIEYHLIVKGDANYNFRTYAPSFIGNIDDYIVPGKNNLEIKYPGWFIPGNAITIFIMPC